MPILWQPSWSLYGFNAQSLTSMHHSDKRKQLAKELREGAIHYLCVVDIFNEGVDIPEVDTVLFYVLARSNT